MKHLLLKFMATTSIVISSLIANGGPAKIDTVRITDFGITPNTRQNTSIAVQKALEKIKEMKGQKCVLFFPKGRYNFFMDGASTKEYYISNHDQDNPKKVGIALESINNLTVDGDGSEFIFHGRMLPISLIDSKTNTLKNFSIDFENPHIQQIHVVKNDTISNQIIFKVAPWVQYKVENSSFYVTGEGWKWIPTSAMAFEEKTKRIVYNTSDVAVKFNRVTEIAPRTIQADDWHNPRLIPGTVVTLRSWQRPAPGIFLSKSKDTKLYNIQVHYAEGMGLLAQLCENIHLNQFSVRLKGDNDPRYFTTQADATHFSGCKGSIISENGFYENMMDDAINVHGTYLKVTKRVNDNTLQARYMHDQSWGFEWGTPKDKVQLVKSNTMELVGSTNSIVSIKPVDTPTNHGVKIFEITFKKPLPKEINENEGYGIENLTWTPEVIFKGNTVRNNRARGALFSTPKKTIVENNLFDHTSGTAILLCGDCNGWYETGACKQVIIRNNRFINALTSYFQFTNAIISIYPEIPNLKEQKKYFHSGILIEGNYFETFDKPIVYAKSTNGLTFRKNTIKATSEYTPFHWNQAPFLFERVINYKIEKNQFDGFSFMPSQDIMIK